MPDDVAAHGKLAKRILEAGLQGPEGWSGRLRQGEALKFRSSAEQQPAQLGIFGASAGPQIRHAGGRVGDVAQRPVETGPALGIDLTLKARSDLVFAARSELEGHAVSRPVTEAAADVFAADDEVLTVVRATADENMDVGIVRIPVIDRDQSSLVPRSASTSRISSRVNVLRSPSAAPSSGEMINRKW
jgi:hypothetical protein